MNYYNENEPFAAAWLRALIAAGEIPDGFVDERSIIDVKPHELTGFIQHHYFAGIGGWPLALKLAGWPSDRPVKTGSCPCQPFSQSGKQLGTADARHLWPHFRDLITFGEFSTIFGEQVASPLGREWLNGVRLDLEGLGYEVGAADLCAASVGAPHIRQRLYWVAKPKGKGWQGMEPQRATRISERPRSTESAGGAGRVADSLQPRLEGHAGNGDDGDQPGRNSAAAAGSASQGRATGWDRYEIVHCRDGKARRFEPGSFPLAHGFYESLACVLSRQRLVWLEITSYAKSHKTDPDEIMRMVRNCIQQGEGWEEQSTGMRFEFHAPALLLDLLLSAEAARDGTANERSSKKEGTKIISRAMRQLRSDGRVVCSSHRRESKEQPSIQPSEAVHVLPFILARHTEAYREEILSAHAALNRVGLLRGYGNAIVPQLAAEFIQAFCEINP